MCSPVSVCLVVCQQDYTQTTERVYKNLDGGPESTPLTVDPDKGTDPELLLGFL